MKLSGAQIVWEIMMREGVDVVFGYPGGANLPIYDAMVQYPVRHVLVRHEQCAAHMADGYARATGKVGVCMATSGPAATNLVTGLATAFGALIPVMPFFIFDFAIAIWISFATSMLAHFGVGAARSFFTGRGIFRSGFDMFIVGLGVAAVGYVIGDLLSRFL